MEKKILKSFDDLGIRVIIEEIKRIFKKFPLSVYLV